MAKRSKATCHPTRDVRGLGLCGSCYEARRLATNPDALAKAQTIQRRSKLRQKYGLTLEDYDKMLNSQNGVCFICKERKRRRLAVDHDHSTGRIRGLLCDVCNWNVEWYIKNKDIIGAYLASDEDIPT